MGLYHPFQDPNSPRSDITMGSCLVRKLFGDTHPRCRERADINHRMATSCDDVSSSRKMRVPRGPLVPPGSLAPSYRYR